MIIDIPETENVTYSNGVQAQITYSWAVKGLKTRHDGGYDNAVVQTYWVLTGTDNHNKTAVFDGATPFSASGKSDGFIEFDNLQEDNVLNWIKSEVIGGYAGHVKEQIFKGLDSQHNETSEKRMPWAPTVEDVELPIPPMPETA